MVNEWMVDTAIEPKHVTYYSTKDNKTPKESKHLMITALRILQDT